MNLFLELLYCLEVSVSERCVVCSCRCRTVDGAVVGDGVPSSWQSVWLPQPSHCQRRCDDADESVNRQRSRSSTYGHSGHSGWISGSLYVGWTRFVHILDKFGKSWNLKLKFSRPWKVWRMIRGMEKSGKILENYEVDLESIAFHYTG